MGKKQKNLRKKIKYLRKLLHILLRFKKPTDDIVVACSQQLDKFIVKYQQNIHHKEAA